MRTLEKSGRTVDEAVAAALEELGVPSSRVKVEVLDEGKAGFLGIGARPAVVRVSLRGSKRERVEQYLRDIFQAMAVDVTVSTQEDDQFLHVDVEGTEAGMLIGHHGQTLDALQYLLNLSVAKSEDDGKRVFLDVEGYRKRREETLVRLAGRLADQVQRTGQRAVLEPMPAQERRIIHLTLQDNPNVSTTSEGDEPFRRVAIEPKR